MSNQTSCETCAMTKTQWRQRALEAERALSALSTKYSAMCDEVDAVRGNLLNCNDTVIRLAGERDALQARLHGAQMCTVCAGDKESAKRINCICGGIGTIWAENDGLRQVLAETRDFKAELEHILKNTQAELAAVTAALLQREGV